MSFPYGLPNGWLERARGAVAASFESRPAAALAIAFESISRAIAYQGRVVDLPIPQRAHRRAVTSGFWGATSLATNASATGNPLLVSPNIGPQQPARGAMAVRIGAAFVFTGGSPSGTAQMRARVERRRGSGSATSFDDQRAFVGASGAWFVTTFDALANGGTPCTVLDDDSVTPFMTRVAAGNTYGGSVQLRGAWLEWYDAGASEPAALHDGEGLAAALYIPSGYDLGSLRINWRFSPLVAPGANATVEFAVRAWRVRPGVTVATPPDVETVATVPVAAGSLAVIDAGGRDGAPQWSPIALAFEPRDEVRVRLDRVGGTYTDPIRIEGWRAFMTSKGTLL